MTDFTTQLRQAAERLQAGELLFIVGPKTKLILGHALKKEATDLLSKRSLGPQQGPFLIMGNDAMLEKFLGPLPEVAYDLMDLSEKPLIIRYDASDKLAKTLLFSDGSIGATVAQNKFLGYLANRIKAPLAFVYHPLQKGKENKSVISKERPFVVTLQEETRTARPAIIRLSNNGVVKVLQA